MLLTLIALTLALAAAQDKCAVLQIATDTTGPPPHVAGNIKIQFVEDRLAPRTVENFLQYCNDGFYNGIIFHRVIPNFMNQGGGWTRQFTQPATRDPIPNESCLPGHLPNNRGTLAMARTAVPNSATSQFYINTINNNHLNCNGATPGYATFAQVVEGLDVVDAISRVPTQTRNPPGGDVPINPPYIVSCTACP